MNSMLTCTVVPIGLNPRLNHHSDWSELDQVMDHHVIRSRFIDRALNWIQKNVDDPSLEPNGAKNVEAEVMKNWGF